MDLYATHKILSLISVLLGSFFALWIYFADRKSKINQYFSILFFSVIIFWGHQFFSTSFLYRISPDLATWNLRLGYFGAALTGFSLFFFCLYFPRLVKIPAWLKVSAVFFSVILAFFSLSSFFVEKAVIDPATGVLDGGIFGWGKYVYYLFLALMVFVSLWIIIRKYLFLNAEEKIKVQYFLSGFILWVIANLIANIFYPMTTGKIHPIGNYSFLVLMGFTIMAVTRYRLFEIKVVLTEILVGIMGVILFIMPLIIDTTNGMKVLMFGVFLIYCVIGYLLIRSTLREAKQKEILEERVKERTKDLNEKIKELDRWYHLTVGRELRMAELKKKIAALEEKQ